MENHKLSRFAPLGLQIEKQITPISIALVGAMIYSSFEFISRYANEIEWMLDMNGAVDQNIILNGTKMTDFVSIKAGLFTPFIIIAACMLMLAVSNYAYHHVGTRSVYLMRRLPNPLEYHFRCLAVPLATVLLCILAALILTMLLYLYYMAKTPPEIIAPQQWEKIWRELL